MTTTESGNRTTITVANTEVEMFTGGSGPAMLFLHGAGGNSGWQPYHEELSRDYTVYVPSQPGFNGTPRPNWVHTINDVCHFNLEMAKNLGLDQYILMGSSMGGWIAAEMAAMCHHNLKTLILVDAAGIKPQKGEIAEIFMVSAQTRLKQRFYDPSQVPNYEQYTRQLTPEEQMVEHSNREMASRLCWRPYLHDLSLPYYLRKVPTPALIVWGQQDALSGANRTLLFQWSALSCTRKPCPTPRSKLLTIAVIPQLSKSLRSSYRQSGSSFLASLNHSRPSLILQQENHHPLPDLERSRACH